MVFIIISRLKEFLPSDQIHLDELMCNHTSFKIGGKADIFVNVFDKFELKNIIDVCISFDTPYFILGNGSNIVVLDNGFRGVIIKIQFSSVDVRDNFIIADSGILLSSLANFACQNNLCGLEFAHGIPGTLGGAVYMNAGAYGGEMSQVVKEAFVLKNDGHFDVISNSDLEFGYRTSLIQSKSYIVTGACFELQVGEQELIRSKMLELKAKRQSKQPLNFPSAGSTFKRPTGFFAGKLIMDSGLAGYSIGGAMVSDKHCGFIVNTGNASARDVLDLIEHVVDTVYHKFGVILEPEIKFIGE